MKNTRKILFSAALLSSGLTMAQTTTAEKSPNVIYIMADDLGIGDLGCYGQRQIKTPNIDGIAQNGMKFMQHYSGSTVSAPSRCALITGKHMGHAAIRGNAKVAGSDGLLYETPLPAGEVTVADIFKTKNYVTGCVGKWGINLLRRSDNCAIIYINVYNSTAKVIILFLLRKETCYYLTFCI